MKFLLVLITSLALGNISHATDSTIEAASVVGDTMYLCVSREARSTGRSYLGEQPLFELRAWSLESHEVSLSTGRSLSRWKADVKRELRLDNSVQMSIHGMPGENMYFEYSSALYLGPMRGRTNQHGSVVLFNRNGLRKLGAFPTNLNLYQAFNVLPGVDGSLKLISKAGAVLYSTNGVQAVPSPLIESPALAEDWNNQRTGGDWGLTLGTFGPQGEFLWHLRYPLGVRSLDRFWDQRLEMVLQVGENVRVVPVHHPDAALLWDGDGGTIIISKAKNAESQFQVDSPAGEGPNLGVGSGALVSDPTARTVVIVHDASPYGFIERRMSVKLAKRLKMTVFRIEDGKVVGREVKLDLD